MENLKNLLVAIDTSSSENAIAYALAMAKDTGSHLTIVLCYDPSDPNAKEKVREGFEHMKAQLLQDASVPHRLVSSDRPVIQTLTETTSVYHPDVLLTVLPEEAVLEQLIEKTRWPTLVVPPKVSYQKIHDIAVAYDSLALSEMAPFSFINQLARHYRAFVHILELDHNASFTDRYNSRTNWEVDYLLKDVKHQFHFIKNGNVTAGIRKFLTRRAADLLVVLSRRQVPGDEYPLDRHTIKIAHHIPKPLMIFKV